MKITVTPDEEAQAVMEAGIKIYGPTFQLEKLREECIELAHAIQVYMKPNSRFNSGAWQDMMLEVADVQIMIGQFNMMFSPDIDRIYDPIEFKLNRFKDRLKGK